MVSELLVFSEASRTTKGVVHLRKRAVDTQDGRHSVDAQDGTRKTRKERITTDNKM